MEERTIKLDIETAKQWYKQGGNLKEVALQAYSEEELEELTYDVIAKRLFQGTNVYTISDEASRGYRQRYTQNSYAYPVKCCNEKQAKKLLALNKLENVAWYLCPNLQVNFDKYNVKYIIFYNYKTDSLSITPCCSKEWRSYKIYFDSKENAEKAIEILGKETIKEAIGV